MSLPFEGLIDLFFLLPSQCYPALIVSLLVLTAALISSLVKNTFRTQLINLDAQDNEDNEDNEDEEVVKEEELDPDMLEKELITHQGITNQLRIQTTSKVKPLNAEEGKQIYRLLSLDLHKINQELALLIEQLKKAMVHYVSLTKRLQSLNKLLENDIPIGNGDELIAYMEVKKPILLFKAYNFFKAYPHKEECWKTVPKSTNILDLENFFLLLKHGKHTRTQEDLTNPNPHRGKKTSYFWHHYEGYSSEQDDSAALVRKKIVEIQCRCMSLGIVIEPVESSAGLSY